MKTEKSFIEQELEREKRLRDSPESKFTSLINQFRQIFGSKSECCAQRAKVLDSALSASRYGLVYPTLSDKPQEVLYTDRELSSAEALKYYLNTIVLKSRRD